MLAGVVCLFAMLSLFIAVATPAWEANDEPAHVQNVQTLVRGHSYRMEPGASKEAVQAPLYYLGLAAWQRLAGVPARDPAPVSVNSGYYVQRGLFRHDTPTDGADQRFVVLLRLPSVLLGVLTVLLTAVAARRLSSDPWTPTVAAAVVAGVPKMAFLSAVINNDNLSNALGSLLTLVVVIMVVQVGAAWRIQVWRAAALGGLCGALVLTKVSTLPMALGAAVVVVVAAGGSWRRRFQLLVVICGVGLVVCGWWLVQNQVRYGDPLATNPPKAYLEQARGRSLPASDISLEQAFVTIPRGVYKSFWYTSGYNQYVWGTAAYRPLWLALVVALAGLAVRRRSSSGPPVAAVIALVTLAIGALSGIWMIGLKYQSFQARLAFMGLPAIGCLAALGLERLKLPPLLRFVGPALGLVGTVVAIHQHVIEPFHTGVG